jgi:benzoyl-CoA reductase/2-hydroxyglutaryl-CoA dehydratase subunit BcrC/BadD/HgdB
MSENTTGTVAPATEKPKKPLPLSRVLLSKQSADLMENAKKAKAAGEMVGWSTSIFPQEVAESLGLQVLYPENFSAGIAARKLADPYLQAAEGPLRYNNDLCSYAKINLAYAEAMHEGGDMVLPDFLLVANNICNQVTKWFQNLSKKLNVPLFMIDTVYNYEDYVTESRVKYVRGQIEKYIADLCAHTGKTWDEDKFREIMEISAANKDLWIEANELLAYKPSPMNGFDLFNYMSCMVCNRGKRSTTEVLSQLVKEIREHLENGTSTYPAKEEYRIFWDGIACWPYLSHNLRTLKQYGINMVASGYVRAWALDYEIGDLDGMARAYIYCPANNNNMSTYIKRRSEALKQFQCDGMIYHVNRSCKVMDCQQIEAQRQIEAITGVPYVNFDGDQSDYRNYSEAQFETRIQGLAEVMKANKEARK